MVAVITYGVTVVNYEWTNTGIKTERPKSFMTEVPGVQGQRHQDAFVASARGVKSELGSSIINLQINNQGILKGEVSLYI